MLAEPQLIEVYRETLDPLHRYVSRRAGGDRALTEDVVQEAWLRALDAWRRRGAPAAPLAWLQRTAGRLLVDHFRRRRPSELTAAQLTDEGLEPGDQRLAPADPEAAALLHWGLAQLRSSQAHLLEAFHFDGQDTAALAAELDLSERAIEGRLRRSRLALRGHLAPWIGGER